MRRSNVAARAGKSDSGYIWGSRKVVYVSDETIHEVSFNVYKAYTSRYTEWSLMTVPSDVPMEGQKK